MASYIQMFMQAIEEQLQAILERNKKVELEKAWELSFTRRTFIAGITYITALVFLRSIGDTLFAIHAVVPMLGYILSTLSLPWIKRRWMASQKNSAC